MDAILGGAPGLLPSAPVAWLAWLAVAWLAVAWLAVAWLAVDRLIAACRAEMATLIKAACAAS
jgi:hypothetical protein